MEKLGISTDCMCDLPENYRKENAVNVMQFYIYTSSGRFWNESEITSDNILDYFEAGNVTLRTDAPEPEECRAYFESLLTRYEQVVHITTSNKIGMSYPNAKAALELMGQAAERITLINSGSVSTGMGHMVMLAVTLRDSGKSPGEIARACDDMRGKISASFIIPNTDYLYRMGYASQFVRNLCVLLKIHPVLYTKNGKLAFKEFCVGHYEKAVMRYIRREFRHRKRIDKRQLFITHAGCPAKIITQVKAKADELCKFEKVTVTKASAVISSCCGPETVGVLYVYQ